MVDFELCKLLVDGCCPDGDFDGLTKSLWHTCVDDLDGFHEDSDKLFSKLKLVAELVPLDCIGIGMLVQECWWRLVRGRRYRSRLGVPWCRLRWRRDNIVTRRL